MKIKIAFQYLLLILCFFAGCHISQKAQDPMQTGFDKQGHRGCRGLMPENTIAGMIHALGMGVTTIEFDVVITKDKQVVLSHEPWFGEDITTKPDGTYMGPREERTYNIYWMTYDQVKTFDVGMKPHPRFPQQQKMKAVKPLLKDLIDSIRQDMITRRRPFPYYNIEIKSNPEFDGVFHPKVEEFVDLVVAVINEKGIAEECNVQSFDYRVLKYMHEKYPSIKTAVLIDGPDMRSIEEQLEVLGFTPTTYSPHFSKLNKELVNKCHALGMKIIPWTVNNKEKIDDLRQMKVDGIITDFPNLFED